MGSSEPLGWRSVDQALKSRAMPPPQIVLPRGLPNGTWLDWKDGTVRLETLLVSEIVPWIDASYPAIASPTGRVLEGYSMGGFGAARLGFRYRDLFGALSILAGGPLRRELTVTPRASEAERLRLLGAVYVGDMDYFIAVSRWEEAERYSRSSHRLRAMRFVVGSRDEVRPAKEKLHGRLDAFGIPRKSVVFDGVGHTYCRSSGR